MPDVGPPIPNPKHSSLRDAAPAVEHSLPTVSSVPHEARGFGSAVITRYVALANRRTGILIWGFVLLLLATVWPISQLELHTDMAELLPDDHPAVLALRHVSPRQISSTNLVLIVESPDQAANRRFAEALRPELQKLVGTVFSEVMWHPETEVPTYFANWRWLYASLPDLQDAETLLDRLIAQRSSPLMVDLEGDPEAELKSLRSRLQKKLPALDNSPYFEFKPAAAGGAYSDAATYYLGVMLWRRGDGLATAGDKETLATVQQLVQRTMPTRFHPQMKTEYSGGIAMAIDEQEAVQSDLARSTVVCVLLVLLSIYLYFRRVAVLVVVGAPAILGVLCALAIAHFAVHYLNANTAFLISIILGNGINTPIILLARYGEQRRQGMSAPDSLRVAMAATLLATGTAMAAASIAYGCLLATHLRGFNQFGLLGGVGMLLSWGLSFLLVPPLVLFGERHFPGLLTPQVPLWRGPFLLLGRLARRGPLLLAGLSVGLLLVLLSPALRYASDPIEYNFDNLRTDNPSTARRWTIMYDLGLGSLSGGHIARDGVILVDKPEQADRVADALLAQDRALGERRVLEGVRTLQRMLPDQQQSKLALLQRLRHKIDQHRPLMADDEWQEVAAWRPPDSLRPLTVSDLPKRLRDNFSEVDGTLGRLVGIDADPSRFGENNGRELIRLSRSLQVTVDGKQWVAAAPSTVFAGMLEIILQDGPRVTLYALLGVTLLVLLMFGVRGAPLVLAALGIGLIWLTGLLGVLGWKLNFLNFVALPITLGVGADYAANIWARIRREGVDQIEDIVADTGSAVALCSITTIIGYSSLLLASNRALQSFGRLANLGEVTCLLAALLVLPALATWLLRRPKISKQEVRF